MGHPPSRTKADPSRNHFAGNTVRVIVAVQQQHSDPRTMTLTAT